MDHHCPWSVPTSTSLIVAISVSIHNAEQWCSFLFLLFIDLMVYVSLWFRVNNCVGYSNYKFFLLFLMYSALLCLWLCLTALHAFISAWVCAPVRRTSVVGCVASQRNVALREGGGMQVTHYLIHQIRPCVLHYLQEKDINSADKFQVIFLYFVCVMFGLSISILFFFHMYLLLFNKTTLGVFPPLYMRMCNRCFHPYTCMCTKYVPTPVHVH